MWRHHCPSHMLSETSHLPQHTTSPSHTQSWALKSASKPWTLYSKPGASLLTIQYLPHARPALVDPQPGATRPTQPTAPERAAQHCQYPCPCDTDLSRCNGFLPAAGVAAAAPTCPRGVTVQPRRCWSPAQTSLHWPLLSHAAPQLCSACTAPAHVGKGGPVLG